MTADGRRQITGFLVAGDVFGFEAGGEHESYAESVDGAGVRVLRAAAGSEPTASAPLNQLSKLLDGAGSYYAHVQVTDGAGNQSTLRTGAYLDERSQTPSLIFPDAYLARWGGE